MNHPILLSSRSAHFWIVFYLAGRYYQVVWRESVSAPRALTTGVPQGLVLGPLLFSLYSALSFPHMVSPIIAMWMKLK